MNVSQNQLLDSGDLSTSISPATITLVEIEQNSFMKL